MEVPLLVNDFLRRASKLYGPSEAVVDGDLRFTWAEFNTRVNQQAHALLDAGIGKGDRVGIIAPNSHQFLETFYATAAIGAIIVPMNYRLIPADFEYMLEHSGSKVVLVDAEFTHLVDEIRGNVNTVEHFIAIPYGDAPINPGWTNYEDWIADQSTAQPPEPGLEETDLLSINYTSGTTARPKGVMITHRNAYINAYNFIAHLRISQDDAEMWTLPMFHANGWGGPYAITAMGGKHVVPPRPPRRPTSTRSSRTRTAPSPAWHRPCSPGSWSSSARTITTSASARDLRSPVRRRRNRSSSAWRRRSAGSSSRSTD